MAGAAADYLEHAFQLFALARKTSAQSSVKFFRVGAVVIEMQFAGDGMARHVMRALGHLQTGPVAKPDLSLRVWDSHSTGTPLLHPHWNVEDCGVGGLIRGFSDERYGIAMQFNPAILRGVDRDAGIGFYWTRSAAAMPIQELGAPLRPLLHDWLQAKGILPIHGGAVGFGDGGVLLAGPGGAGKSNAALSCLRSPLRYASDDFCVLSDKPWTVHSLYSSGKVNADSLGRLQHLNDAVGNPGRLESEKALFFLQEKFADRLIAGFPLRAIVLPRISPGTRSAIGPISGASAHRALAMSTAQLLPEAAATIVSRTAALVRSLPCYEMRIGEEGPEVSTLIAELLSSLDQSAR